MTRQKKSCSVPDCIRPFYCKGVCKYHYVHAWIAANPEKLKSAQKRYYEANRDRIRKRHRAWSLTNREKINSRMRAWYADNAKNEAGITNPEKRARLSAQGGKCAVCGATSPGGRGYWHSDHNHVTGQLRDELCNGCNSALGHTKENPQILRLLASYIERHNEIAFDL